MRRTVISLVFLVSVLAARPASAAVVTVGCGLGPGFDYANIQTAVNGLAGQPGPHTVKISGACSEVVIIDGADHLTLVGDPGAQMSDPGGGPTSVIRINNSNWVEVRGLLLSGVGANTAITTENSSNVRLINLVIDHFRDGVVALRHSSVLVGGVTIDHAVASGVTIGGTAEAQVVGAPHAAALGLPTTIRNGQGAGLTVSGAANVTGTVTVEDNQGPGVNVVAGGTLAASGPGIWRNNGFGLAMAGGWADVVQIRVEGNRLGGVLQEGGHLTLRGFAIVTANLGGAPRPLGFAPAGIVTHGGYLTLTGGAAVTNNAGFGVMLSNGASGRMIGASVTGNSEPGVRVQAMSSLFIANMTVTGNQRWDLSCAPESAAHGLKAGIGRVLCPGFAEGADGVIR